MPVLRYIVWVTTALLAAVFILDGYLPKAAARSESPLSYKIAIEARRQGPEAVSFSGDNLVFTQPVIAATAPQQAPTERGGDASANVSETALQVVTATVQPSRIVKRKIFKPTTDHAQSQSGYTQNVAYHRSFEASPQRGSMVW